MNRKEVVEYIENKLTKNQLENTILFYGEDKDLFKEEILYFAKLLLCLNLFFTDKNIKKTEKEIQEKINQIKQKKCKCRICLDFENITEEKIIPNLKITQNFWNNFKPLVIEESEKYEKNKEKNKKEQSKQIKTAEVKDFFQDISYKASRKIYILDDAHLLNVNAQNAILKLIEEPTEGTYIFLMAGQIDSLLNTIKSRCTKIYLHDNEENKPNIEYEEFLKTDIGKKTKDLFIDAKELNKIQYIDKYNKIIDSNNISIILDNLENIFDYSLKKNLSVANARDVIIDINKKRTYNMNENILKVELILGIYNLINLNKKNHKNKYNNHDDLIYK